WVMIRPRSWLAFVRPWSKITLIM
ncbi:hypothetical protein HKBW3S33_00710, partial [Candidatus Hakubella thermalkaliphila]